VGGKRHCERRMPHQGLWPDLNLARDLSIFKYI